MSVLLQTILLLALSNVFMTFAWYAHLKEMNNQPWIVAALASWGIALFEYLLQVPVSIYRMSTDILPEIDIPVVSVVWQYTGG